MTVGLGIELAELNQHKSSVACCGVAERAPNCIFNTVGGLLRKKQAAWPTTNGFGFRECGEQRLEYEVERLRKATGGRESKAEYCGTKTYGNEHLQHMYRA